MRLAMFVKDGRTGIAASTDGTEFRGALDGDADYPGDLDLLIGQGADLCEAGRKLLGGARKPPVWMKAGDVCGIEVEGLGTLRNPVANQQA